MNHCIDCGRRVSIGRRATTHSMTRCAPCEAAWLLRDFRYVSPATRRWEKKGQTNHGGQNHPDH